MSNRKPPEPALRIWDCDNNHRWLSIPGPEKDTWHLEQLHESTTGTYMKLDPRTKWLVAGPDPSICPMCAMRMRAKQAKIAKVHHIRPKSKIVA